MKQVDGPAERRGMERRKTRKFIDTDRNSLKLITFRISINIRSFHKYP